MNIYFPGYYNEFHCIAAACPDSCCKEWSVDVDAESAKRYRALTGALGERLREVLQDTDDGTVMQIENGRCPMWQQDGLCRIQAELGHDALCETCRSFPRLTHDYGNFVELGLELSCPEVARLIFTSQNWVMECAQRPETGIVDYDPTTMQILLTSRQVVFDFLESSAYSLPEKLAVILLYSHNVQAEIDGGNVAILQPEKFLKQLEIFPKSQNLQNLFDFFSNLEILTRQWRTRLLHTPEEIRWAPELKAMARYLIQRYWLQAISDYDLVCRVKLIVASCILVTSLGGDLIPTAQLFSKEIENNPENIDAILDGAYTVPALSDQNLFGILLPQKRENS